MRIIAISILFWASTAFSGISTPNGSLRKTTYSDLKDHSSSSSTYNEFWTYSFFLNGKIQLYFNFSRANLGSFKDPVCGTDISIVGLKGKTYTLAREYPKKNFKFTDSVQQLNVHKDIWFSGALPQKHRVYLHTTKDGVEYLIDLEFSEITPGQTWGDGIFKLGSERVGIFIHIPKATVKGKIAINRDTVQVRGTGYMDHTFQTDMGTKLVETGYRYSEMGGPINLGYILVPLKRYGSTPIGFGILETEEGIVLQKPKNINIQSSAKAKGIKVPTKLSIQYEHNAIDINRTNDSQQLSILNEFSGVTKWAVKKFMGGEVLYFRGIGTSNEKKISYSFFGVD